VRIIGSSIILFFTLFVFYNTGFYNDIFSPLIEQLLIEFRYHIWGDAEIRIVWSEVVAFLIPIVILAPSAVIFLLKSAGPDASKSAKRFTWTALIFISFTALPFSIYPAVSDHLDGAISPAYDFSLAFLAFSVVFTIHLVFSHTSLHEMFRNEMIKKGSNIKAADFIRLHVYKYVIGIGFVSFLTVLLFYLLSIYWDELLHMARLSPVIQVFILSVVLIITFSLIYLYLDYNIIKRKGDQ